MFLVRLESSLIREGTSCSTPTWGGVVGLLNDVRLQSNKSTLGFLNPYESHMWSLFVRMLYQLGVEHPEAFFDVTNGCNPSWCPNYGFCGRS